VAGSNKDKEVEATTSSAPSFPPGTIVEFNEKNREHVGKIIEVERKKVNGSPRYEVQEYPSGKHFSIADKEVSFSIPAPTNVKQADKLLEQLEHAHSISEEELSKELDLTPELLEMAWEETAATMMTTTNNDADGHHREHEDHSDAVAMLTPNELIELVHSHKADHIERYEAWRLLRSEIGHIFFKEIKEHGRVVAFKAKPRPSVEASKDTFRSNHMDDNASEFWRLSP
jgi:hypothetical protein